MSYIQTDEQLRLSLLGRRVSKQTGTLTAATSTLFTVAGGICLIRFIVGEVTTAVTVANSYKLQANPTTGTVSDLHAAVDIGSTDTPAGTLLSFSGLKTDSLLLGVGSTPSNFRPIAINTGTIEQVSAGTDGAITWTLVYLPITDGATIVAA